MIPLLRIGATELRFDAVEHRYFVGDEELPSVTRVLESERLLNFGGASTDAMYYARELGSAIHLACELDDVGDLAESQLDITIAPYLAAWRRFCSENGFEHEAVERRVFHPTYRFAGTLDRVGRTKRCECLIDIKSGQPQRATGYQTAAYLACLPRSEQRRKRFGCYLRANGTYSLVEYSDRGDLSVFLAALTLYNARGNQ